MATTLLGLDIAQQVLWVDPAPLSGGEVAGCNEGERLQVVRTGALWLDALAVGSYELLQQH